MKAFILDKYRKSGAPALDKILRQQFGLPG
jgi:hypothetical protein